MKSVITSQGGGSQWPLGVNFSTVVSEKQSHSELARISEIFSTINNGKTKFNVAYEMQSGSHLKMAGNSRIILELEVLMNYAKKIF